MKFILLFREADEGNIFAKVDRRIEVPEGFVGTILSKDSVLPLSLFHMVPSYYYLGLGRKPVLVKNLDCPLYPIESVSTCNSRKIDFFMSWLIKFL